MIIPGTRRKRAAGRSCAAAFITLAFSLVIALLKGSMPVMIFLTLLEATKGFFAQ
jgi:hypothetical protein